MSDVDRELESRSFRFHFVWLKDSANDFVDARIEFRIKFNLDSAIQVANNFDVTIIMKRTGFITIIVIRVEI